MPYDLYGNHYTSARDAENAEMAQCAAIDADIANRRIKDLEKQLHENGVQQEHELYQKVEYLMFKVERLEEEIERLKTINNE
ncbi:hypothetical protein ACLOAU_14550 [Niabella sp. CJ426]|uniref:hypothetical protein n=1 Tax=Niabella sp. CJ426 TaxID=3393740 RepID=UPI003CFE15F6